MKAIILLYCVTGFGDQYSNILTGYKACNDLLELGYDVEIYWLNNNLFFSSDINLDCIYDFSLFYEKNIKIKYIKNEVEIPNNYIFLPSNQNAIKIFVTDIHNSLINYDLPIFDYFRVRANSYNSYNPERLPNFTHQFIKQDIIDLSNKIVNKDKIKCVHFRCDDDYQSLSIDEIFNDEFYSNAKLLVTNFINENKNEDILILSNNKNIRNYFDKNFKNTFVNKFNDVFELHQSYNSNYTDDENINHSKFILAEMVLLSKCYEIFTVSRSLSNFLTYGIIHNKHHTNWETKIKDLIKN